jgi:uncharacterized membrane protein YeaQ/YmgE (transglycosylase-associated protein family)
VKQDNPGCFRDQIWQFIGVILTALSLALIILIWFFPNPNELFTHNQSTPISSATITPTATSTKQPSKPIIPSLSDYIPNTGYIPNALVRNIICIIFGIVQGFLASILYRGGGYGIIGDIIIGIVGAYVGYLFISLLLPASSLLAFSVFVLIGSWIVIFFFRLFVGSYGYRRRL